METYAIMGTGGMGREVMAIAFQMLASYKTKNTYELIFVVDELPSESTINGHRVIKENEFLALPGRKNFCVAIADYHVRERIVDRMIATGVEPFIVQSLNSIILGDNNDIGDGAIIYPYVTVTVNVKIGKHFQAYLYSHVDHDCVIGDYVSFMPAVHCNGGTVIEDYAYIGTGACIRHSDSKKQIVIGEGAIVGMGAVVTKSVPAYATVLGNPARITATLAGDSGETI